MSFRKAILADIPAIVKLVNSAYRGESSRAGWTTEEHLLDGQRTDDAAIAELITGGDQFLLLKFEDGALVGSVHVAREDDAAYLGMLSVDPFKQARGTGRALIAEVERLAREEIGASRVRMTVISVREELIAYYERRGYRRTGETRVFPMDDVRFGQPKRRDFELVVLEKSISATR